MKVKVCGLKNRENIREIIACKPDFIGFIFYPQSRRYVGDSFDPRLLRHVPPYINKVGVFVNEDQEILLKRVERYGLDYVQLHGEEDPSYVASLKSRRISIIKSFRVDEKTDFQMTESFLPYCDYFLFDTRTELYGGSGDKFNWDILQGYGGVKPFLLSGGINPEDTAQITALKHSALIGVDINSGFEISPGMKDVFKVNEFIKTIKNI
ncbi:MAG: phosphoribosylanthranilate isomerase [Bacteroidales bacterium]|nr:phosphoribosylanthranilate isomerase [Bacteroidales bacterium]MBN2762336.1 phosphoribosylanthranilate isomerase [Bacteroidales bacterium]